MTPTRARRLNRLKRPGLDTRNSFDGNTQGMGLIVLEAALALAVLVFLIWWTMFSGRRGGEWHDDAPDGEAGPAADPVQAVEQRADQPADQPAERGGTRKDAG